MKRKPRPGSIADIYGLELNDTPRILDDCLRTIAQEDRKKAMILDTYETTPLCVGWDCTHCHAPLEPDGLHVVNPEQPDGAFCSVRCAVDYFAGLRRPGSVDPRQAALPIT